MPGKGKPFPKGTSGNPAGRPVGALGYKTMMDNAMKQLAFLDEVEPEILEQNLFAMGFKKANEGDYRYYSDFMDRRYGKPIQTNINENNESSHVLLFTEEGERVDIPPPKKDE